MHPLGCILQASSSLFSPPAHHVHPTLTPSLCAWSSRTVVAHVGTRWSVRYLLIQAIRGFCSSLLLASARVLFCFLLELCRTSPSLGSASLSQFILLEWPWRNAQHVPGCIEDGRSLCWPCYVSLGTSPPPAQVVCRNAQFWVGFLFFITQMFWSCSCNHSCCCI